MEIKEGSKVLVVTHPSGKNFMYNESEGFDNAWVKEMDKLVETIQVVESFNSSGVILSGDSMGYRYPPSALKIIEE